MKNKENFLPVGYGVPKSAGNYMKFTKGENRLRILASPVVGYECFRDDGDTKKPVRVHTDAILTGDDEWKHFWAMPVWNYQEERVQILEITQKGLMNSIKALSSDKDWGSPVNYDLVITKTGEMLNTSYSLQPKPASEVGEEILQSFEQMHPDLDALFTNDDPFRD